jgi:hypothetical protein
MSSFATRTRPSHGRAGRDALDVATSPPDWGEDLTGVATIDAPVTSEVASDLTADPRLSARHRWLLAGLAVALDALIAGPLVGRGRLFLLDFGDYPVGPHPQFAPSALGFPPGVTSRAPIEAALYWLFQSTHWEALVLLPFVAVAPMACAGFARLFPGRVVAIAAATLLFTVNPFVYERMANGQIYVVMGYSLLPLVAGVIIRPLASRLATAALGGALFALQIALSVHYLFIAGLMIVVLSLSHAIYRQREAVIAGASSLGAGIALSLYWLVPVARDHLSGLANVSRVDLSVFSTLADPRWGLGVNVAGLYGFWRSGAPLVKDAFAAWPLVLAALVGLAGFGLSTRFRRGGAPGRALALSCGLLVVLGLLLALGAQGPTGGVYVFLFRHLPGFKVMREPQKFSALIAVGYAVGFGAAAEALVERVTKAGLRAVVIVVLAALPLLYGYTELWGLDGFARPTTYPPDWTTAQSVMTAGTALALPWTAYVSVPWLGGDVVANPLSGYFDLPVLSGDNLQAGPIETESTNPRSLFILFALTEGPRLHEFGRDLAALGVRYVVLAKAGAWQDFNWLDRQDDLTRVFNGPTIAVYQNEESVPLAYEPRERITVRDWGAVLALAERVPLTDYLIDVRHARPGPLVLAPHVSAATAQRPRVLSLAHSSLVAQSFSPGRHARDVVLTVPAYQGWTLADYRTTSQFGVTVAFTRSGAPASGEVTARYGPWGLVETWDIIGAVLLAGDLAVLAVFALGRMRHRRWPVELNSGGTRGSTD